LKSAAREVAEYKLDLVGVQDIRWNKENTEPEVNKPFRRAKCRWDDNIEIDLKAVG
jgi:hypothetical protein